MEQTYHGSCHCGGVRFEARLDLMQGTGRCNCSMCAKTRFWKAIVRADRFRLLAGESLLCEYRFGAGSIQHLFCSRCGVKPFGRGHLEGLGDFAAINIACLDGVSDEILAALPVRYEDGRRDRWEQAPAVTRHL